MESLSQRPVMHYHLDMPNSEDAFQHGPFGNQSPSSLPPQTTNSVFPPISPAKTTSKRRRPSGTTTDPIANQFSINYPAAPEVPTAPPASYRPSPTDGFDDQTTNPPTGSFAQRAAVLTGRSLPPDPNRFRTEEVYQPPSTRKERRTSLNRPIGGLYSEIQQHRRDSWPAGKSPTSPRRTSFAASPREGQNKTFASPSLNLDNAGQPAHPEPVSPPKFEKPRRTATNTTERYTFPAKKANWASDRSPLQKLEVKLSDISKEEKRARVEQAEQRLRDSKLAAQQVTLASQSHDRAPTTSPEPLAGLQARPAGPRELRRASKSDAQSHTWQESVQKDKISTPRQTNTELRAETSVDRGVRFEEASHFSIKAMDHDINEDDTGLRGHRMQQNAGLRSLTADQHPSRLATRGKSVPSEQQNLYSSKAQHSKADDTAATYGGAPDILPAQAVASASRGHKHEVPPQTAAGIQARQRVGFDKTSPDLSGLSEQHRYHLPRFPQSGRNQTSDPTFEKRTESKSLDEWTHAGVARLGDEDFQDIPFENSPWWEKQDPHDRRRSERGSISVDDPYPDGNGEYHRVVSSHARSSSLSTSFLYSRSYRADKKTKRMSMKDLLSILRSDTPLQSLRSLRKPAGLLSEYSYSCPSLADHDSLHPGHVCEPYVSKELITSMRSIRIRAVPASTTFSPPLYLKCGPLLRYTGMKRDKLERNVQGRPQPADRETWRGSVMIVTTDIDSQYEPAPILRLFPEPMEKIPPPQRSDPANAGTDELPHHYMDPIAGLPKLSRTGKTIFVKPVDDLEHGRDLSHFESNDDGLYEDFRSAAVPTAYGTPEYRHNQLPSPHGQSRPKSKPKRGHRVKGVRLHAERGVTFWRFNLEVVLQIEETRIAYSVNNGPAIGFWVPARGHTMNVMFHSCNGFSLSVK